MLKRRKRRKPLLPHRRSRWQAPNNLLGCLSDVFEMITVLTLCSANYLAHAKTLGDSLAEHHPDFHFVIGLVDRVPKELTPSFWHPYELIPVEELGIPAFWEMVQRY